MRLKLNPSSTPVDLSKFTKAQRVGVAPSPKPDLPNALPSTADVLPVQSVSTGFFGAVGPKLRAILGGSMLVCEAMLLTGCGSLSPRGAPLPTDAIANLEQPAMPLGAFVPAELKSYGLFKLFWETDDEDLSLRGLREVSVAGAQKIYDYALTHNLEGDATSVEVSVGEKALVRTLLEDPYYRAFFKQDARVKLAQLFDLPIPMAQLTEVDHRDHGEIHLPARVSQTPGLVLGAMPVEELPAAFAEEYQRRRAEFEGGSGSDEEKSRQVLGLLHDYAAALWSKDQLPGTDGAARGLLEAFERTEHGLLLGAHSYNGAPWGAAQGMVLGILDPNTLPLKFTVPRETSPATYLSMDGGMAEPMKWVDRYRVAIGLPPGAENYEKNPPINHVIGEPDGHNKAGSFSESAPFASSGINWGLALWPGDAQIRRTPPQRDFEFQIDALDAHGELLSINPAIGERLGLVDKNNDPVRAEKVVHSDGWTARFYAKDGRELEPHEVKGVLLDADGNPKGDGKVDGSKDMWWWGFCDVDTAQELIKTRYQIPQIDKREVKVRAGQQILRIPQEDAQKIFDSGVASLARTVNFGFRFDAEPATITTTDGRVIVSKLEREVSTSTANVTRGAGDLVTITVDEHSPVLGTIALAREGSGDTILPASEIVSLTQEEDGTVLVQLKSYATSGRLKSEVDWSAAKETDDGKRVLTQDESFPIRGELAVKGPAGEERIPISQIATIQGETQDDLGISSFTAWVSGVKGLFATDSSPVEVVSNGIRTIDEIHFGTYRADGPQVGSAGPLVRQRGDRMAKIEGIYHYNSETSTEAFGGWVQVGPTGRIINEAFTEGRPDFGWTDVGSLDWTRTSSFNPYDVPDLRLSLLINGARLSDAELEKMAERLNFPPHWRTLIVR